MKTIVCRLPILLTLVVAFTAVSNSAETTQNTAPEKLPLYAGWAECDITPEKPIALVGQLTKRISKRVLDPLTATALALETRDNDGQREQAILISCDHVNIRKSVQQRLQKTLKERIEDFDSSRVFLNATHTHTAPGFIDGSHGGLYDVSKDEGVMKASEYADFFLERVANLAVEAWEKRKPSGMSWALGQAVVGHNRRAHYFDGSTVMYGKTHKPDFSNIEGYEDAGVEMVFIWEADKQLAGIVLNIACPSQETEGLSEISADFWHDVRLELRKRYSPDLYILPQCGAAGDISPHLLYRKQAENLMQKKRGISRRQEIARRIANAVDDVFPIAKESIEETVVFKHHTEEISLPIHEGFNQPFYNTDPVDSIELHVLRLGDIAMATNPFELYHDYGLRIKARSPALLTFLIQLSCQNGGYLPTEKAIQGGGYSADKFIVGPRGGQVLVEKTLERIDAMWE